jgi:hypothetical protein
MPEIVEEVLKRTETSKTFDLGGGKKRLVIGGDICHYKNDYADKNELWKDTNPVFENGQVTKAPYTLVLDDLTVTMTSKRTGTSHTISLDSIDKAKKVKDSTWEISGNKAVWKNAAKDTDIEIECLPEGYRYKRILKTKDALLEAEYLQSKSVGSRDDIQVRVSARDADEVELEVTKTITAGKITEAIDKTKDLSKIKYPLTIDPSPLVVQPGAKDATLNHQFPTSNAGTSSPIQIADRSSLQLRGIFEFDISALPAGQNLTSATFGLYYYSYGTNNPSGKSISVFKLTRTDWVEAECTWNIYKTGSNWSTAGGDYDSDGTPASGNTTFPSSYGWMSWNVLAICQDAYSNSLSAELLQRFDNEAAASFSYASFYSREYSTDTTKRPKLTIEYEAAGSILPIILTHNQFNGGLL